MLRVTGVATFAVCVWAGVLVVVAFDESWWEALRGAATGALLFGAMYFFLDVREVVPSTESLRESPPGAEIERHFLRPLWLLAMFPGTYALAWVGDRWDLELELIPALFAGMAAARLVGAVLVRRWEREHGGRVLIRRDDDGTELYAASR